MRVKWRSRWWHWSRHWRRRRRLLPESTAGSVRVGRQPKAGNRRLLSAARPWRKRARRRSGARARSGRWRWPERRSSRWRSSISNRSSYFWRLRNLWRTCRKPGTSRPPGRRWQWSRPVNWRGVWLRLKFPRNKNRLTVKNATNLHLCFSVAAQFRSEQCWMEMELHELDKIAAGLYSLAISCEHTERITIETHGNELINWWRSRNRARWENTSTRCCGNYSNITLACNCERT